MRDMKHEKSVTEANRGEDGSGGKGIKEANREAYGGGGKGIKEANRGAYGGGKGMSPAEAAGYGDILSLPHPTSRTHPRMPTEKRAAQFSPFAALSGYEDAIEAAARISEEQLLLDQTE